MSYYAAGDYYRGDYYRGDLKSMLSRTFGVIRKVAPLLGRGAKMIPGVSTVTGAIGMVKDIRSLVPKKAQLTPIAMPSGFSTGMQGGGFGPSAMTASANGCPSGFHPCKSERGCIGGPCVRNRRMNPANPKALRRGLRRVSGFAKLAQRTKRDIGRAATAAGVRRGAPRKGRK